MSKITTKHEPLTTIKVEYPKANIAAIAATKEQAPGHASRLRARPRRHTCRNRQRRGHMVKTRRVSRDEITPLRDPARQERGAPSPAWWRAWNFSSEFTPPILVWALVRSRRHCHVAATRTRRQLCPQ